MRNFFLKLMLSLLFILAFGEVILAQKRTEYEKILGKFEEWKYLERKKGTYASEGCCMILGMNDCENNSLIAIPKEIQIFFSDMNDDENLDALISFKPIQCDGGNALMNAQEYLFIISEGNDYYTDDKFIHKIEEKLNKEQWGFLRISELNGGSMSGIYHAFKPDDFRCCPSIEKEVYINYQTKQVRFLNKN